MTVITQLPDPPSRTTPSQFSTRTDAFLGALPGFVTETNAVASEVNADKTTAVNSAAIAVTKAAEATASAGVAAIVGTSTKWVSGTSYTEGQGVWSPVDLLPYRRLTNGAGAVDPSNDPVNWDPLPPVPMVRVIRTSNIEITSADRGHFFDIISGVFSQTFSSKEILGSGFYCYILNSGTGLITIDPDGLDYTLFPKHSLLIQCDGSALRVVIDSGPRQIRLPIFSPEASTKTAVSVLEDIGFENYSTLISGSPSMVVFGNSLFIVSGVSAQGNVSTSPDGITWTLRVMPSSAAWRIGTNGTNKFVATVDGGTTTAKSTNGVTWSTGTPLPGAAGSGYSYPVFNGDVCLVQSSPTICYTTSDGGVTWSSAQTIPMSITGKIYNVGGLFWAFTETNNAYTSPTGSTGSWTARTLPVNLGSSFSYTTKTPDGKLSITSAVTAGALSFESSNGIDWISTGHVGFTGALTPGFVLNGVRCWNSPTFPGAKTMHNGEYVQRMSSYGVAYLPPATNGTVVCLIGSGENIARFDPTSTTNPTAIFEG